MNKTFVIDYITIMQPKYIDVFLISRSRISVEEEKDLGIVALCICLARDKEIHHLPFCDSRC